MTVSLGCDLLQVHVIMELHVLGVDTQDLKSAFEEREEGGREGGRKEGRMDRNRERERGETVSRFVDL